MKPKNITLKQWWFYNILFFLEHFLGHERYQRWLGKREKKLIAAVAKSASSKPGRDDFRIIEYQKGEWKEPLHHPHFPIIFRGAASDWPSAEMWTMDYFAEHYGDIEVTLLNNAGLVGNSDQSNEEIKLRDYLDLLKKGTNKYLKFSRLINDNSVLRKYFDEKWLKKFKSITSFGELYYFFIGAKGTITPIHNGFSRTIFVQVVGTKKWVFYAPEDMIFLGARPERTNYYYSAADPYNLDDPKYPLMKYAKKHEILLNPGDVLFFPPLVWHQVENVTETIGVAYKFADIPSAFRTSKIMAFLYFFSTNPPLFNSTAHLWKEKKAAKAENAYGATI